MTEKNQPFKIPASVPATVKEWFSEEKYIELQAFKFTNALWCNNDMNVIWPRVFNRMDFASDEIEIKLLSRLAKKAMDKKFKEIFQPYEVIGTVGTIVNNYFSNDSKIIKIPQYAENGTTFAGTIVLRNLETRLIQPLSDTWLQGRSYDTPRKALIFGIKDFADQVAVNKNYQNLLIKTLNLTK